MGIRTLGSLAVAANALVMTFTQNLDRLKLDYDTLVPVHAPNPYVPWHRADLQKAVATGSNESVMMEENHEQST